ncbi:14566_t:CDS:2, partial [Dentiscutata heterogama]
IHSAVESRKRRIEIDPRDEEVPVVMYGIVTNALQWYFLRWAGSLDDPTVDLSGPHICEFDSNNMEQVKIILGFITSILQYQVRGHDDDSKSENAKLKAEVAKLRHDIEEIKLQTRVNTNEQDASLIEDISQFSACLESPVTLEAQRSTRWTSSNSLPIKDLSDKKYSMIPQSCNVKTVTKCHDQNYILDNSDIIYIEISESDNQIVEGLIQEMTCNQTQSIVSPEINSISLNKSYLDNLPKAEISAKSSSEAQ